MTALSAHKGQVEVIVATPSRRRRWLKRLAAAFGLALFALASVILWAALAEGEVSFDEAGAAGIAFSPLKPLIPGPGLPKGAPVLTANNNLDVALFERDTFVAYRTGPSHFASEEVRLVVLRSRGREDWTKVAEFDYGSDLREPRFLVFNGKLFFYFFRGGTDPFRFEPKRILACEWTGRGFSEPREVFEPGFVNWRARARGEKAYMSVYKGAGIDTTQDRPGEVRLLVSEDGYDWEAISEEPQVTAFAASECEFEFTGDGGLFATVRCESTGSLIARADKDDLARWQTRPIDTKVDSGCMFRRGERFFVIARRDVAGGPFLRGWDFMPRTMRVAYSLARYSLTRKRTSLYELDRKTLDLKPLFDFPSKGDTAFAGLIPIDGQRYYLLNYSSPIDGPDWVWIAGQLQETRIYETILSFEGK